MARVRQACSFGLVPSRAGITASYRPAPRPRRRVWRRPIAPSVAPPASFGSLLPSFPGEPEPCGTSPTPRKDSNHASLLPSLSLLPTCPPRGARPVAFWCNHLCPRVLPAPRGSRGPRGVLPNQRPRGPCRVLPDQRPRGPRGVLPDGRQSLSHRIGPDDGERIVRGLGPLGHGGLLPGSPRLLSGNGDTECGIRGHRLGSGIGTGNRSLHRHLRFGRMRLPGTLRGGLLLTQPTPKSKPGKPGPWRNQVGRRGSRPAGP